MKIKVKYQLLTAALIGSVVVAIAAMVMHTQRNLLEEQAMQRLQLLLDGSVRIAKEASDNHDRLMAVSYLMFLKKTYQELAFASVSCGGNVSRIGKDTGGLLYLESDGRVPGTGTFTPAGNGLPQGALQAPGKAGGPENALAAPSECVVRLGFLREIIDGQVKRALSPLMHWTAGIAGGFMLLGLLVNSWLAGMITKPIETLAQATGLLAAGHMEVLVPVLTNDEMGTLTRSFNSMACRLRELMASREDVLHTLTHELNTPLSGVKGYLELWQDGKISQSAGELREILGIMMAAVIRMEHTLGNALRLFVGDEKLRSQNEKTLVTLRDVFTETIAVFMSLAKANKVEIVPPGGGAAGQLLASEELVRRIVNNLVSNAIKYTPSGGRVSTELAESGEAVVFHIRNTGPGIPAADIPRLFTKFYRSSRERMKGNNIPGTGLGLNIVHKAVAALGGRVWVESRVDEYTQFSVSLPKKKQDGAVSGEIL